MTPSKVYRKAVAALKPNRAKLEAAMAEHRALNELAMKAVQVQLATGRTARELYDASCAIRTENETDLAKYMRVILLGMVRKAER